MTMKKAILCMMMTAALAACGVKPGDVKPPSGAEGLYPGTYPQPEAGQTAYDLEMSRIRAEKAAAEAAAQPEDKPDWSIR